MGMDMDIHRADNGHIRVRLRGDAVGEAEFQDSAVFAKFVEQCQAYNDNSNYVGSAVVWMAEESCRSGFLGGLPVPERWN